MEPAQKLSDNVDVSIRAQRAHDRTNGNSGRLHRVLDIPEPVTNERDTLWKRIKDAFPTPEEIQVGTRQVTGFVIPHWAAGVTLAAILTCMGFLYSRLSDQRDMLIVLQTKLEERSKYESDVMHSVKEQGDMNRVYVDNLTNQVNLIKGMLTQQQLRTLDRNKRTEN